MRSGRTLRWALAALFLPALASAAPTGSAVPDAPGEGADLYQARCATCHDHPAGRIPPRFVIAYMRSPDFVLRTIDTGLMQQQAAGLTMDQKKALVIYLTGKPPGQMKDADPLANQCKGPAKKLVLTKTDWNGWGRDSSNTRFQPEPGLRPADVPRLKVKWAFAYPGANLSGQPTVVGGRVFLTSQTGLVFALDADSGCTRWATDLGLPSRTAISVAPLPSGGMGVFLGDEKGAVHALDAETGKPLWRTQVEEHHAVRLTGAATYFEGKLFQPVSSQEEGASADPTYPCCTFRGSVVALDAATGKQLWKFYTLPEAARPLPPGASGGQKMGPAGVAVWASPTVDAKRRLLYVATGDSYTAPAAPTSDSVIALDIDTGAMRWVSQVLPHDAWVVGCEDKTHVNCPGGKLGPDFDLGSAPLLVQGGRMLIASSKSGTAFGLDPDAEGKILWEAKLARGGTNGGIEWGPASDGKGVYVALSDANLPPFTLTAKEEGKPMPEPGGLVALEAMTGKPLWRTPAPKVACSWGEPCTAAQVSAVTAMPGIAFSGAWDGHLRAYRVTDGKIVWDVDTAQTFDAVNGVKAYGGALDAGAQTIAGGTLFVNSGGGYPHRGNALLAFTVDGR